MRAECTDRRAQTRNFSASRDWPDSACSLAYHIELPASCSSHRIDMKICAWLIVSVNILSTQCSHSQSPPMPVPAPSPSPPPDFTLGGSLTRPPTEDHPTEPVLAGDDLAQSSNPSPPMPVPVPSPPPPPDFTLADSLTRPPTEEHPTEPVLAGDDLAQSSNTSSQGSHHSVDIVATADADHWAGWRKLFQRALPFFLLGTALCCSCMACGGCYIAFKRLSQPSSPAYGPGQPAPYRGQLPPAWPYPPAHPGSGRRSCKCNSGSAHSRHIKV